MYRPDRAGTDRPRPEYRPASPREELFAAGTPTDEPVAAPAPDFDITETTPIFEEIASAWFRSNRPLPVDVRAESDTPPRPVPRVTAGRPSVHGPGPFTAPGPFAAPAPFNAPAPFGAPPLVRRPVERRAEPERVAAEALVDRDFHTLADEGWRVANDATAERGDEVTAAGLPKRRPRARLVPGSAGSAVLAPPATPSRSAETVRGRLASYQQGVRLGRENRSRGDTESTPASNGGTESANGRGNHDEESS